METSLAFYKISVKLSINLTYVQIVMAVPFIPSYNAFSYSSSFFELHDAFICFLYSS